MSKYAYLCVDGSLRLTIETDDGLHSKYTESDIANHLRHEIAGGRKNTIINGIRMQDLLQELFGENSRPPSEEYSSSLLAKVHANIVNQACVHARFAFQEFDQVTHFLKEIAEQHGGMSAWYQKSVAEDASSRDKMQEILNGVVSNAAQGGQHMVIDEISWHVKNELELSKNPSKIGRLALHRMSTGLHYMVMEDSTVPYQDIIRTIEAFEKAGYSLEIFGTAEGVKQKFSGYSYGDNLMHLIADKAHQKSNFALEVLTYLAGRGLDPTKPNNLGATPIELMKNNPTRNAWREMLRQLEVKKAAMNVLDELGLGGLKP